MASMQCYKEEGREFDYYSSYGNQKPTTYSSSDCEQTYYEKEKCYETKPEMMGYGHQHGSNPCGPMMGYGHQHGSNPCGPMMGHGMGHNTHGGMGYGTGHSGHHGGMGYGTGHNGHHGGMGYGTGHNMHKPGSNGLGMDLGLGLGTNTPLGHVMGFGKKHEGHGSYGMGSSGCNTYKKQHRRRRGYGSDNDCSDSSDDERRC